uniref:GIY-YIG domain-containing protein n=1 Tax=Angiostrongylus cantonensis TaxID=6313 RepID=A0A0K0DAP6_ANGCA
MLYNNLAIAEQENYAFIATSVCTSRELREESRDEARQIAIANDYEIVTLRDKFRGRATPQKERFGQNKVPFILPFISDEIGAAMKRCLTRADLEESVATIEIPPNTLRRQLVRNRLCDRLCETQNCVICSYGRDGDYMSSGTIYLISCGTCGDEYIGETGRPLCIRIKEHLDGKRKARQGTHRIQKHNGDDFDIKVAVLARDAKTPRRKLLEAFWINAGKPTMNSREECPEITCDLAPYLRIYR